MSEKGPRRQRPLESDLLVEACSRADLSRFGGLFAVLAAGDDGILTTVVPAAVKLGSGVRSDGGVPRPAHPTRARREGRGHPHAHRLLRSLALVALLFAVVGPVASAQADPVAVFRQVLDARNRGDLAGVMALFTDDAFRQDGNCQPSCVGTEVIRRSFESNIAARQQTTVLAAQAAGNTVTARAELRNDRFRALGAERVITLFTIEVRGGKIARWTSTLDAADAQTAAYQVASQAQTAQAAPAATQLPRTGSSAARPRWPRPRQCSPPSSASGYAGGAWSSSVASDRGSGR